MEFIRVFFCIVAGCLVTVGIEANQSWAFGTALTTALLVLGMPEE